MNLCKPFVIYALIAPLVVACASDLEQLDSSQNAEVRKAIDKNTLVRPKKPMMQKSKNPPASITQEMLIASPPASWKHIYSINEDSIRLSDFVPSGETSLQWQTKLSIEAHQNLVDLDPIEILLAEANKAKEKCTFVQHFNFFSGYENGYPTSLRLIMCGENEFVSRGELSMLKVIQGDQYLYIVRFLKRIPPFKLDQPDIAKQEIATWSDYLRKISVCRPGDQGHPCPQ